MANSLIEGYGGIDNLITNKEDPNVGKSRIYNMTWKHGAYGNPEMTPELINCKGFESSWLSLDENIFPEEIQNCLAEYREDPYKYMFPEYHPETKEIVRDEVNFLVNSTSGGMAFASKLAEILVPRRFNVRATNPVDLADIVIKYNNFKREAGADIKFAMGVPEEAYEKADLLFIDNFELILGLSDYKRSALLLFIKKRISKRYTHLINVSTSMSEVCENKELKKFLEYYDYICSLAADFEIELPNSEKKKSLFKKEKK